MFKLYLLLVVLPNIGEVFAFTWVFSLIGFITFALVYFTEDLGTELKAKSFRVAKILFICATLSGALGVLIPAQSDIIKIYGGDLILNNHQVKKLSKNSLKLLNKYVEKELKDNSLDK